MFRLCAVSPVLEFPKSLIRVISLPQVFFFPHKALSKEALPPRFSPVLLAPVPPISPPVFRFCDFPFLCPKKEKHLFTSVRPLIPVGNYLFNLYALLIFGPGAQPPEDGPLGPPSSFSAVTTSCG